MSDANVDRMSAAIVFIIVTLLIGSIVWWVVRGDLPHSFCKAYDTYTTKVDTTENGYTETITKTVQYCSQWERWYGDKKDAAK